MMENEVCINPPTLCDGYNLVPFGICVYSTTNIFSLKGTCYKKGEKICLLFQDDFEFVTDFVSILTDQKTKEDEGYSFIIHSFREYNETIKGNIEKFIKKYITNENIKTLQVFINKLTLGEYIAIFELGKIKNSLEEVKVIQCLRKQNHEKYIEDIDQIVQLHSYDVKMYGTERKKIGCKNKSQRVCRWCNKGVKDGAFFKEDAHAISESLGNKNLILYDECDSCNGYFGSEIEPSLINLFLPFTVMNGVRGKKHIPHIANKSCRNKENRIYDDIFRMTYEGERKVSIKIFNNEVIEENGKLKFNFDVPGKVIEQNIYKTLCKYALSLIENEEILSQYQETIEWLRNYIFWDKVPIVKSALVYAFYQKYPELLIYTKKEENSDFPDMFVEFHYLCFVWIYIVPKNRKEAAYFSDINTFNKFWENTIYAKTTLDWSEREYSNTISRKLKYNFSFEPRLKLQTTKELK